MEGSQPVPVITHDYRHRQCLRIMEGLVEENMALKEEVRSLREAVRAFPHTSTPEEVGD